ncbi:MAG: heavy metal-binding domain-containing protein [Pirellulaceae bacterium]
MEDIISLVFLIGIPAVLFLLGFVFGGMNHHRHLQDLEAREQRLSHFTVSQIKSFPAGKIGNSAPQLIVAETVVGSDYLKSFLGGLRNIFGGEVRSFQGLIDRARREATLRVMEEAERLGYNAVCNLRLETADVGGRGNNKKNKIVMASIIAYGTAYHASV